MKVLIRSTVTNLIALYLTGFIVAGFVIDKNWFTLLVAATVLTLLNKLIKPIIKLLLLPINLITLGLFSWVIAVITIFILTVIINGVAVTPFTFPGIEFQGFIIPAMKINLLVSYILSSIVIYTVSFIIRWVYKK